MEFTKHISEIEEKIGYIFNDKSLLRQAFTRTSYTNENKGNGGLKYQSNEVLEFFGDSVLSAAIVTLLVKDFAKRYEYGISTTLNEGDFSNIKSKLSDKKNLSLAIKALGIEKFLQMGEGDAKLGIQNEPSVMEDLFESIIGAIYIDSSHDMKTVIASVSKMLDVNEYFQRKAAPMQSFKNALQEWCADKKHRLPPPIYKTLSEDGPDHKKTYERACYIGDKVYGIGVGKNQKLADSAAAEDALTNLKREYQKANMGASVLNSAAIQTLKELAQKEKKPSPEFRDLGETLRSTPTNREFEIECRFAGLSAIGAGSDKKSAKGHAAEKLLEMIKGAEKKAPQKAAKKALLPKAKKPAKAGAKAKTAGPTPAKPKAEKKPASKPKTAPKKKS
jgi:ribonuclease-3